MYLLFLMTTGERFKISEKIVKTREFESIFKNGKRTRSKNFSLVYIKNNDKKNDITTVEKKIGIIIKHEIKGAIIRNKLKRRLRTIYRQNKSSFSGKCIIIAQPGAEKLNYDEIKTEVLNLTVKAQ